MYPSIPVEIEPITCENCLHCFTIDFGYSNYTVEGTEFHCEIGAHPKAPFDRFYGTDPRLSYATICPTFIEGVGISMDVDGEELSSLSEDERTRWNAFNESSWAT